MTQPILALFDLDHTLLPIDSDYMWGKYLVEIGAVPAAQFEQDNQRLMDSYNAGTLEAHESLPILLAPLAAHPKAQLDQWHQQYMQTYILPNITSAAQALVAKHAQQGHLTAIVTATNSFVTQPVAQALKVPHLVATEPELINEKFTGNWIGTPCFKEGKVTKVKQWLATLNLQLSDFEETWFYSDSSNDIPLLEAVTHPVACNPSNSLEQTALARGWRIIRLW